ncbi:MAG: hypothetical protein U9O85_04890 [Euryarchaeota archaeon]|nr:hypothetical protein [Euryarchaeota archaeon]
MKESDMTNLKYLLNCDYLIEDWNLSYGVTKSRSDALTRPNHPDSFLKSHSETALTLFLLGNMDGWKQIGTLKTLPRDKDSKWSKTFFENIRESQDNFDSTPTRDVLWMYNKKRKEEIFECEGEDIQKSILLFEFEIMNSAFHSVQGKPFKELSFLDIRGKKKWSRFDAVLIVPNEKLFVFFESKFTRDVTPTTKDYPFINQIMRNLESAFLLTNHQDSLYKDWKFKYALICPREIYRYKLKYYPYVFDHIKESIDIYNEILEKEYKSSINKACYPKYFESFAAQIPECVFQIYWDELGTILQKKDKNFFPNYFNCLKETGLKKENIENIKRRLRDVGINDTD